MSWERPQRLCRRRTGARRCGGCRSAVAHDAGLAARVATLARLRAVVTVLPSQPAPPPSLPFRARRRKGSPRGAALAASLVLAALLVAGAYRFVPWMAALPDGLSLAVQAQRQWLASDSPATRLPIALTTGGDGPARSRRGIPTTGLSLSRSGQYGWRRRPRRLYRAARMPSRPLDRPSARLGDAASGAGRPRRPQDQHLGARRQKLCFAQPWHGFAQAGRGRRNRRRNAAAAATADRRADRETALAPCDRGTLLGLVPTLERE